MQPRRLAYIALFAAVACGPKPSKPPETPVKTDVVVDKPVVKKKTADVVFLEHCRRGIATAETLLPTLVGATGARTVDNTLVPLNQIYMNIANSIDLAGLYSEVHPDEAVQTAARTCEQEASAFATGLMLNRQVYDAIAAVKADDADADTKRFITITLRDFRRAGVDKDEATRSRLEAIDKELTQLGQTFSTNIAKDTRAILVDSVDRLKGLPDDYIAQHPAGADGKIKITTDYPDYLPFMTYAEDDVLRHDLYVVFRSRGDQDNEKILSDVLALRSEKAMLLGYANWADYITEDKMIKSGKAAGDFIERVAKLAKKRAAKDYAELLKEMKTIDKSAKLVEDWQKSFLENRVKIKKYSVDSKEIRPYFPYAQTLQGLLDITSELYDVQYTPVVEPSIWHPDVKVFDVKRGETKLGRIYLDMQPRERKYKHAAQFPLIDGVSGVQLPEGVLVCNFPGGNELMEHDDVVTMFHEFGHLMHHILGGDHKWVRQSGVATEQDFVEAPSQMFEEWAWNYETLSRFAKNADGETIPKELVERMRRADKFGGGTQAAQQMFYAAISLQFHQADPETLDQLALVKKGLMNTELTHAYRDKVLAAGGTKDAADLVKDFLGRDYNFKAFEKFLAE